MYTPMHPTTDPRHVYQAYGEIILERFQATVTIGNPGEQIPIPQWNKAEKPELGKSVCPIERIAIVGAGVAGLHAATMLGKDFKVDVYEASKRIGGRLYTHKFDNVNSIGTTEAGGTYDYFDVGAMRFPDTDIMKKTFDLFEALGVPLIPYRISGLQTWLAFNEQRYRNCDIKNYADDPFKVGIKNGGKVPDEYACQDPADLLNAKIQHLVDGLIKDYKVGLEELLKHDKHSTRSYLQQEGYESSVINYIETMCNGTGGFDKALAETVLEELCFRFNQTDSSKLKWKCVNGGSCQIPLKMVERLKAEYPNVSIKTGHQVTAVRYDHNADKDSVLTVSGLRAPTTPGGSSAFKGKYSHVIFAIPPPCLRTIDLSTCQLDYVQRNALRQVSIGPSCKIGMKFKTAWWNKEGIKGGQSSTDRMARTIVYPSHGDGTSTVLIVSYSWTQDAVALSALMKGRGTPEEERLKEIMLADLAYVHNLDISFLREQLLDMYPWDWTHHPYSMGAFGLFGPNQFSDFYCALTRPAARGHIHFVGETISTTHGWVAGALESAERGAYQVLTVHKWALERQRKGTENRTKVPIVKEFKETWNPQMGVNVELLKQQLAISIKLQEAEFGVKRFCRCI